MAREGLTPHLHLFYNGDIHLALQRGSFFGMKKISREVFVKRCPHEAERKGRERGGAGGASEQESGDENPHEISGMRGLGGFGGRGGRPCQVARGWGGGCPRPFPAPPPVSARPGPGWQRPPALPSGSLQPGSTSTLGLLMGL